MDPKHISPETVTHHCIRVNVDVMAGWEKGVGPRRKEGGRLYDHSAPDHLTGQRWDDWMMGYRNGKQYRKVSMRRAVYFTGTNDQGTVEMSFSGWSMPRGRVVTRMIEQGCHGDVYVSYMDGGEVKRTVTCGI